MYPAGYGGPEVVFNYTFRNYTRANSTSADETRTLMCAGKAVGDSCGCNAEGSDCGRCVEHDGANACEGTWGLEYRLARACEEHFEAEPEIDYEGSDSELDRIVI